MEGRSTDARALAAELSDLLARGQGWEAVARCREVFAAHPDDAALLRVLVPTLMEECEAGDGVRVLSRLAELVPGDGQILFDLSLACQQAGDLTGAEEAADKVLAIEPGHPVATALRAEAIYLQGRYREVFEYLAPLARAPDAHVAILPIFGRLCKVEKKPWQGISPLERVLEAPGDLPPIALIEANFVLADLYNSARRYDQAWEVLTRANTLKGASFDPDEFDARIDATIAAWTPEAVAALPVADNTGVPILIVGMPRSGTTMIEQMLANHPRVAAGGELPTLTRLVSGLNRGEGNPPPLLTSLEPLTANAVAQASARYEAALSAVAASAGGDIGHVTDKMPINALQLGLVQAIAPRARVLWIRRDPLDTAISCYFHHFGGANSYAYNLTHLGRFHRSLERLMLHWQKVLRLEILELPYEEMVADLPGWTRRMLEFIGLPWDDACLRFHESRHAALTLSNAQVRQPLFTSSIGRWKPYAAHLKPLAEALGLPEDHLLQA